MARTIIDPELEAIKAGDEVAFEAIITRYHGPLMRLAMAYVRDHGVAEDVVQETWLTCLRTLDRFEGRSSLKTWIFGILLNVARARRRKESRVVPFASLFRRDDSDSRGPTVDPHRFGSNGLWTTPPDSWSNLPESRVINREALDRVKVAIEALPEKQREVVILRDVAGMDSDEVCELLAISATNQRVRLHRGRAAVRRVLEEYLK
ncbi:MAG TPA: sigma-70 family RNA polymerase sigma factor [Solirubrobacterales bacterium]